jgi:hypothetical protein
VTSCGLSLLGLVLYENGCNKLKEKLQWQEKHFKSLHGTYFSQYSCPARAYRFWLSQVIVLVRTALWQFSVLQLMQFGIPVVCRVTKNRGEGVSSINPINRRKNMTSAVGSCPWPLDSRGHLGRVFFNLLNLLPNISRTHLQTSESTLQHTSTTKWVRFSLHYATSRKVADWL